MWLRRAAENSALVVAAVLMSAALFEFGLRWFGAGFAPEPVTGDQYEFYRFDPELGWSNAPNVRAVFARKEFAYDVRINSLGLRGPEIGLTKPAGVRRVAVLGDSYAWGIGARESELFATLIEQAIPDSQVLNFGVSGYGPVQYELLTGRVLEFAPEVVVIAFCLGNDFADNVFWRRNDYYKPFARIDERGALVVEGYPLPKVHRFRHLPGGGPASWLYDNSTVVRMVDSVLLSAVVRLDDFGQIGPDFREDESDLYRRPDAPAVDQVLAVYRKLFEQIAAKYQARGISVVVLAVPTKCELGTCFPDAKADAARLALARSLETLPLTLIDPTATYSLDDFWSRDGHWRPSGHRKAADALVPTIRRLLGE